MNNILPNEFDVPQMRHSVYGWLYGIFIAAGIKVDSASLSCSFTSFG